MQTVDIPLLSLSLSLEKKMDLRKSFTKNKNTIDNGPRWPLNAHAHEVNISLHLSRFIFVIYIRGREVPYSKH